MIWNYIAVGKGHIVPVLSKIRTEPVHAEIPGQFSKITPQFW